VADINRNARPTSSESARTEDQTIDLFDACLDALTFDTIIERLRAWWSLHERQRAASELELEDG
jgi:hypothetical protein